MHIEGKNIMHIGDRNIITIEDKNISGKVNKFTGETLQRGSSNTNEVYLKILNIRLQLGF